MNVASTPKFYNQKKKSHPLKILILQNQDLNDFSQIKKWGFNGVVVGQERVEDVEKEGLTPIVLNPWKDEQIPEDLLFKEWFLSKTGEEKYISFLDTPFLPPIDPVETISWVERGAREDASILVPFHLKGVTSDGDEPHPVFQREGKWIPIVNGGLMGFGEGKWPLLSFDLAERLKEMAPQFLGVAILSHRLPEENDLLSLNFQLLLDPFTLQEGMRVLLKRALQDEKKISFYKRIRELLLMIREQPSVQKRMGWIHLLKEEVKGSPFFHEGISLIENL